MAETMREIMNPSAGAAERSPAFRHAPPDWTPSLGEAAARHEGIEPTEDHWATVRALQEYFARHERPNMRELHDALDERFHAQGGMRYLYTLLPGGPVAQGCRIAGLEPPAGSVDPSFGTVQ